MSSAESIMPILTGNLCFLWEAEYQISKDSTVPENCSSAVNLCKWWTWHKCPDNSTSWETLTSVIKPERLRCVALPDCTSPVWGCAGADPPGPALDVESKGVAHQKKMLQMPVHLLTSIFKCQQAARMVVLRLCLHLHNTAGKNPNDGEFQQILLSV